MYVTMATGAERPNQGLGQVLPPPDWESMSPEEREVMEQETRWGLVAVIVAGVGALVLDEILKRRR